MAAYSYKGVVVSSDTKSCQQCIQVYSKASRILAMINRTITYKSSENLVRLYKSLVRPHLEYCTAAWSHHYVKDKVLIEKIQTIYKNDSGTENLQYEDRLRELNLWTLKDRRVHADLIEVSKIVRGLSSTKLEAFFELDNKGISRGHQWKLKKKWCNTDLRQHFNTFSRRG